MQVNLLDVNEHPELRDVAISVNENLAEDTDFGSPIVGTDVDAGQTLSYEILSGNDDDLFQIDAATGQLSVAEASIDYERRSTYALTVQATDNGTPALSTTAVARITVKDLNEYPVFADASRSIEENVGANVRPSQLLLRPVTVAVAVGVAVGVDGPCLTRVFRVMGCDCPGACGSACHRYRRRCTHDVELPPRHHRLALQHPPEHRPDYRCQPRTCARHPRMPRRCRLYSRAASVCVSVCLCVSPWLQILDYESGTNVYSLIAAVSDGELETLATITISLIDVNEAPTMPATSRSVNENSPALTTVGAPVQGVDVDAGQKLTYFIVGGNTGEAFFIDRDNGQVSVRAGGLNHEAQDQYLLQVQVVDNGAGALRSTGIVTVSVLDVNDPPTYVPRLMLVALLHCSAGCSQCAWSYGAVCSAGSPPPLAVPSWRTSWTARQRAHQCRAMTKTAWTRSRTPSPVAPAATPSLWRPRRACCVTLRPRRWTSSPRPS